MAASRNIVWRDYKFSAFCVIFIWTFLCSSRPGVDALKFLNPSSQILSGFLGMNIDINCSTDDTNATVQLLHSQSFGPFTERTLSPEKLHKNKQVFTLLNLSVKDAGQYRCKATDGQQTIEWANSGYLFLTPGILPDIILDPSKPIIILQGKTGKITCQAVDWSVSKLSWKKTNDSGDQPVPDSKVEDVIDKTNNIVKAILTITNAQPQDSGEYKCVLTAFSKQNYKLTNIRVDAPTQPLIYSYTGEKTVDEGTKKTLRCTTKASPKANVTWYRHGKELQNTTTCSASDKDKCKTVYEIYEDDPVPALHTPFTKHVLEIHSATYPRDQGEFKCIATNGIGQPAELIIDLDILAPPTLNKARDEAVAKEGEETKVICDVKKSNPIPNITWKYQTVKCDDVENCLPDESKWIDVPSNLLLTPQQTNSSQVLVEKSQSAAFYRCQADNGVGNDTHIVELIRIAKSKKLVQFEPDSKTQFDEQGTLRLACIKRCGIFCTSTLFKDGHQLSFEKNDSRVNITIIQSPNNRYESRKILTIKRLTLNDTGSYRCGLNGLEFDELNITIKKLVATDISKLPNKTVIQDDDRQVQLYCNATGYPKPILTWYIDRNGEKVRINEKEEGLGGNVDACQKRTPGYFFLVESNPSDLVICSPSLQHVGKYTCLASSPRFQDKEQSAFINVLTKSKKIVQFEPDSKMQFDEQGTLRLACIKRCGIFCYSTLFKDGRQLSVEKNDWRVNITIIQSPNDRYESNKILTIKRLTLNDTGSYRCGLGVLFGFEFDELNITIKKLVAPDISKLPNKTVIQDDDWQVQLYCNATGYPKPILTWYIDINGEKVRINEKEEGLGGNVDACQKRTPGYFFLVDSNPSDLVICSPSLQHVGKYTCLASSPRFQDKEQSAFINVLKSTPVTRAGGSPLSTGALVGIATGVESTPVTRAGGSPLSTGALVGIATGVESTPVTRAGGSPLSTGALVGIATGVEPTPVTRAGGSPLSTGALVGIALGVGAFVLLVLVICCVVYRRQKKQIDEYKEIYFLRSSDYQIEPDRSLLEQCGDLPYDPDWEFPEERLILGDVLGAGAFGQVMKAEAIGILALEPRDKSAESFKRRSKIRRSSRAKDLKKEEGPGWKNTRIPVAVKTLKEGASESEYKDLASELKILIHLGQHKNIVNLLGACTRGKRLMMIMEFAPHGSLLSFLRSKRDIYEPDWTKTTNDPNKEFTLVDLVMISYQISRGMAFLASRKCVHRDLAARNILVGEDFVMKIADFGLARDIYKDDLYVKKTQGLLPVKWMAPESLFDRVYTEKTDVWSFGILLWETFTLGGTPYPDLPTEQLLDYLSEGRRMDNPAKCPLEVYTVMRDCWLHDPEQRPPFTFLNERLGKILERHMRTDNPYLALELDDDEGVESQGYYLQPCDSGLRNSKRYVESPICSPTSELPPNTDKEGAGMG
ncbi:vascular endothelial growth factor receptor 2-like [Stylophora pistillata]|uniref:vascular endothelial growth factor receptor 2-like n=1 Tax=Stylophora pistillata TaxID=50429 RepID=UPI000C05301D|nr:vascular endothelial growth factor receptor 2-like [Stylophora pistillata]